MELQKKWKKNNLQNFNCPWELVFVNIRNFVWICSMVLVLRAILGNWINPTWRGRRAITLQIFKTQTLKRCRHLPSKCGFSPDFPGVWDAGVISGTEQGWPDVRDQGRAEGWSAGRCQGTLWLLWSFLMMKMSFKILFLSFSMSFPLVQTSHVCLPEGALATVPRALLMTPQLQGCRYWTELISMWSFVSKFCSFMDFPLS